MKLTIKPNFKKFNDKDVRKNESGLALFKLAEESCGSIYHLGYIHKNITSVGGRFEFDMNPTHYCMIEIEESLK